MQNYKDVCGKESMVWFEIHQNEGKDFLRWAKSLGCVWMNGKEINPNDTTTFFHLSISDDGTLANVPMFAWLSKERKSVPKYRFSEYSKGGFNKKTSPKISLFG